MTIEFPPRSANKAELLARIADRHERLERLLNGLSANHATTVLDDWSAKDHVAHLLVWLGAARAALNRQPMWLGLDLPQPPADPRDWDSINATVYGLWRDVPFEQVQRRWRERFEATTAAIKSASEAELQARHVEPDAPEGLTVIDVVSANTYEHFLEHETWLREQLGRHGIQL